MDGLTKSEKQKEDWMNSKWRPMMGWMYMAVCACDFIVFPVLWSIIQAVDRDGAVTTQWQPITLQGAGLFHMAMGAVLGIAAFGRTQEKLADKANDNAATAFPAAIITQPTYDSYPVQNRFDPGYKPLPRVATTASGKKIVPIDDEPLI